MATEKFSLGVLIGASVSGKFASVTASVSKQLAGLGKAAQELNHKRVKLTAFDDASTAAKAASAEFFKAKESVAAYKAALDKAKGTDPAGLKQLNRQLVEAEQRMTTARRAMDRKVDSFNKSKAAVAAAGLSLGNYRKQLQGVSAELERTQQRQARFARAAQARTNFDEAKGNFRSASVSAAVVGGGVIASMIRPAMQFEDAMLGVAKQVDGARDANGKLTRTYFEMRSAIQAMGLELPMATNEIAQLVTQAARMGIQGRDNLLTFAGETAKMATAFEMPAEEIGDQMGKIAQLYKIPIASIGDLGDSINYLDDNAISKGKDIIDVMQRMGGSAATLGMSAKNSAALASTFLSLGESAERAGTASEGMLRQLNIAKMNPKRFQQGVQMIGMSAAQLQKGMTVDAQGTILTVLERIKQLKPEEQMEAVTRLFGKDWGGAIAKLANGMDEYRRQLELANGAERQGSMDREMAARQDTTSAHWQRMKNGVGQLAVALGSVLLPQLNSVMEKLIPVAAAAAKWADENPALVTSVLAVAGALVTFKLGAAAIGVARTAMLAFNLAVSANPVGLMVRLMVVAGAMIFANWGGIVSGLKAMWADLSAFGEAIWNRLGGSFSAVLKTIGKAILDSSPLGFFYQAWAGVLSWFGVDLPAKFTDFGGMIIDGLIGGVKEKWTSLKSTMSEMADTVTNVFKKKTEIHSPSRIFKGFGQMIGEGARLGILGSTAAVGLAGAQLAAAAQSGDWGATTTAAAGAMRALPAAVRGSGAGPVAGAPGARTASAGGAEAMNITIHISQLAGESSQALADRVVRQLRAAQAKTRRGALGDWGGN